MRLFYMAVIEKLTPNLTGDETEEEPQEKCDGYNALRHLIWDLRLDWEYFLAYAVVRRIEIDCKNMKTIPTKMVDTNR